MLRGFEAAARHLNFTRAAQELFLTQSAISREIKRLEEQLGQALYRAVGEAFKLVYEVTDRLATSRGAETITLTTSAPLASMWLVPKLPRYIRVHPEVVARSDEARQPEAGRRMRFSHYDQVTQAAIDGSGVAIGRTPHNARHLSEGLLVAPLGSDVNAATWVARCKSCYPLATGPRAVRIALYR